MRMIKAPGKGERGQILAMAALLMTALLGFVGLAIDAGIFYADRRQTQNAADEAATAAARVLANGGTTVDAQATALEYVTSNGYDDGVTVNIPPASGEFAGQADHVQVVVENSPNTFFIHVVVPSTGAVKSTGVATYTASADEWPALFAGNTDCNVADALQISGSNITIDGVVHSNSNGKVHGSNNAFNGDFTYSTAPGCQHDNGGSNNSYTPPVAQADPLPFPINDTYASICGQPGATVYSGSVDLTSIFGSTIPDGIYCTDGNFQLAGPNVTGTITLAALGAIVVASSDFNINASYNDILLFSESANIALDIAGQDGSFTGIMAAPNGKAKVAGSNNTSLSGSIMADTVQISGSNFSLTAIDNNLGGPATVALVE